MRVDLSIIDDRSLHPWPNKYEPKRYYVEFWKKKFLNDLQWYNDAYQVHRRQDEVSVYFDTDGFLHICCRDDQLAWRIQRYFENWYDWIARKEFSENTASHHVGMMIEPFHTDLENGFVQIRYGGKVCNLSPDQLSRVRRVYAESGMYKGECIHAVDTGIARLDDIVNDMLEDQEVWPHQGKKHDEYMRDHGLDEIQTSAPNWWYFNYDYDTRFFSWSDDGGEEEAGEPSFFNLMGL